MAGFVFCADRLHVDIPGLRRLVGVALLAAVLGVSGCAGVDFDRMRREHAEGFVEDVAAKAAAELPDGEPVGLRDCIRIALANNLDVQTSRINRRLAGLDRKIAFSNFLPHVNIGVNAHSSAKRQALGSNGFYQPMSDRSAADAVLSAQQAVFAPETWFLYSAYVKGEGVSERVADRTRDVITLQVTTLYYACLSREQSQSALSAALEQAQVVLAETEALGREGLAMGSQVEQARTLVRVEQARLDDSVRLLRETRSALLEAMGLSPVAQITLKRETPLVVEDGDLSDQILQAMLARPELHIADRTIEIRKDETRIAIAGFLPDVMGFADLSHNTDSFLKYGDMLTVGASGVMTVFDGFANIHEYRAARQREKQAAVDRRQQCLKIMLEVVQARSQYERALDRQAVAAQELYAAETLVAETEAQWREGLLMASERLDVMACHAGAIANASTADFQTQVAAATLLDVMGLSVEGNENE